MKKKTLIDEAPETQKTGGSIALEKRKMGKGKVRDKKSHHNKSEAQEDDALVIKAKRKKRKANEHKEEKRKVTLAPVVQHAPDRKKTRSNVKTMKKPEVTPVSMC